MNNKLVFTFICPHCGLETSIKTLILNTPIEHISCRGKVMFDKNGNVTKIKKKIKL
jgi:transcription elongation factor Elf1